MHRVKVFCDRRGYPRPGVRPSLCRRSESRHGAAIFLSPFTRTRTRNVYVYEYVDGIGYGRGLCCDACPLWCLTRGATDGGSRKTALPAPTPRGSNRFPPRSHSSVG